MAKRIKKKSFNKKIIITITICLIGVLILAGGAYLIFASHSKNTTELKQNVGKVNPKKVENKTNHNSKANKSAEKNRKKHAEKSDVIPKEYQGNWYDGKKLYCTVTSNEINVLNSGYQKKITKDSSPLKLPSKNADGSYTINDLQYMPGSGGDLAYYWISYMTIDGKKEPVIVGKHRQMQYSIYTQHPTNKTCSFVVDKDGVPEPPVGVQDMDKYYHLGTNLDDYTRKMQADYDDSNNDSSSDNQSYSSNTSVDDSEQNNDSFSNSSDNTSDDSNINNEDVSN